MDVSYCIFYGLVPLRMLIKVPSHPPASWNIFPDQPKIEHFAHSGHKPLHALLVVVARTHQVSLFSPRPIWEHRHTFQGSSVTISRTGRPKHREEMLKFNITKKSKKGRWLGAKCGEIWWQRRIRMCKTAKKKSQESVRRLDWRVWHCRLD